LLEFIRLTLKKYEHLLPQNYLNVEQAASLLFPATKGFQLINYPLNFFVTSGDLYFSETCSFFLSKSNSLKYLVEVACHSLKNFLADPRPDLSPVQL